MFITNDIKYIGVNDRNIDLFEGQYIVPNGIAYNSYVILDEEIAVMENYKDAEINKAKRVLAYEVTKLVHGEEEAQKAQNAAMALFGGGADDSDMPTTEISKDDLGKTILDIMLIAELIPSKGEGRRLVQQGGVALDGEKVSAADFIVTADVLKNGVKIKKGKKVFHKAIIK